MRLVALSPIIVLAASMPAAAQGATKAKSPQGIGVVVDLRIPLAEVRSQRGTLVLVGGDGRMIAAPQWGGDMVAFDSTGKLLPGKQTIGGSQDPEITYIAAFGWVGKTMWVHDPRTSQIALVDAHLKVTKSLEIPAWVRPSWADRRKYPVFARFDPIAVYPDGSWLVVPSGERSLVDTPEYDKTMRYFLRIAESGSIQRMIARARVPVRDMSGRPGATGPAAAARGSLKMLSFYNVSSDGSWLVIGTPSASDGDSTHTVTLVNEKGDTLYSRVVQLPSPIAAVRVGRDGSVWMQLRGKDNDRTWLGLDPSGQQRGVVTFENPTFLYDADASHLWTTERINPTTQALVRYRITTAPPPRSPAPSRASGRPRPPASASPSSRR
jgi:hypothetical protein